MNREERDRLIDEAINIAARADDLAHLVRVASRFEGGSTVGLAAWLHDSIEDGYATEDELRELHFPERVIENVLIVSRRDGEQYFDYIDRVRNSGNVEAMAIKIADLRVNLARAKVDRFSLVSRYQKALRLMGA
jgi:predicted metal-dependent HD superfamily phosphohydrolase